MSAEGVERDPDLAALGRRRRYPNGSVVFFEGDPAREVFVVVDGAVRLECTAGERSQMLDLLGPGDLLGEIGVLCGGTRSATAVAATQVEAQVIDAAVLIDRLASRPDLWSDLLGTVALRLVRTSRRHAELGSSDGLGRVCNRLVELVDRFGRPAGPGIDVQVALSQADIGSWSGLSRETVVKSMSTLRRLGWIRTNGRTITVVDVDALRLRGACPAR